MSEEVKKTHEEKNEEKNVSKETKGGFGKMLKKFLSNKTVKKLLFKVVALLIVVAVSVVGTLIILKKSQKEPTLEVDHLSAFLEKENDLVSAKLKIKDISKYNDDGFWIFTNGSFMMQYEATIFAGIDMSKVSVLSIDESDKVIKVRIPQAEIHDVKIESGSLKFFDENFVLFNVNEKDDLNVALEKAEEEAWAFAPETGILEFADEHARLLIKDMLEGKIYDYKVEFVDYK